MTSRPDPLPAPARAVRHGAAWSAQRPEPGRFWVRYRPRRWPGPDCLWSDLAQGVARDRMAPAATAALPDGLLPPPAGAAADVVYLPPVPPSLAEPRRRLAERISAQGTPVLLQRLVGVAEAPAGGENRPAEAAAPIVEVLDPLPLLVAAGWPATLEALAAHRPPPGSTVALPLVPGYSDGEPEAVVGELAALDLAAVQPLSLDLSPAQRRLLAAGQEAAVYDALFHRPAPTERSWVRALGAAGAAPPFLRRPLPVADSANPVASNRRLASGLALAAELWLRVGRSPEAGQALYRASRWIDGTQRDLAALAREGNLGVLPELDERACRLVAEAAAGERYPSLTRELLAEYRGLAAEPGATVMDEKGV